MQAHHLARQAQPDAGTVLFRREERHENFLLHVFGNAGAVIGNLQSR